MAEGVTVELPSTIVQVRSTFRAKAKNYGEFSSEDVLHRLVAFKLVRGYLVGTCLGRLYPNGVGIRECQNTRSRSLRRRFALLHPAGIPTALG